MARAQLHVACEHAQVTPGETLRQAQCVPRARSQSVPGPGSVCAQGQGSEYARAGLSLVWDLGS